MKKWEAGRRGSNLRGDSRYVKGFFRTVESLTQHMRSEEHRGYLSPERIVTGVMTEWKGRTT